MKNPLVALATFLVLRNHMWLVATILVWIIEHFHHCRNFCWALWIEDQGYEVGGLVKG